MALLGTPLLSSQMGQGFIHAYKMALFRKEMGTEKKFPSRGMSL
jgi:hypothetical protein